MVLHDGRVAELVQQEHHRLALLLPGGRAGRPATARWRSSTASPTAPSRAGRWPAAHLWTFNTGHGAVQASPLIVDLNKDGHLDVITADTRGDVWGFTPSLKQQGHLPQDDR